MPAPSSCRRCSRPASATIPTGRAALLGIAVGVEVMCRLSLVAPKAVHKAGFHPTAVFGAMAAAAARRRRAQAQPAPARRRARHRRLHGRRHHRISRRGRLDQAPARRAGRRNRACARRCLARAGFLGPRTVFEGVHGLFHGFAHTTTGDYDALTGDFGARWLTQTLAFKPYPCGTMTHPYIDCARRLAARGIKAEEVEELVCEVGEGTVHRLWEPLAAKQRPPNGYAGKFSTPYCIARRLRARQCRARRLHRRGGEGGARASRSPRKCATGSIRDNPYPDAISPATSAPCSPTAAWSRSASRTCAAARTSRSRAATSRTSSCSTRATAAGMRRGRSPALALMRTLFDGRIDLSSLRG